MVPFNLIWPLFELLAKITRMLACARDERLDRDMRHDENMKLLQLE